jgi:hypothetical protein
VRSQPAEALAPEGGVTDSRPGHLNESRAQFTAT